MEGDHQRGQDETEHDIFAKEAVLGKDKTGQRAGEERHGHDTAGHKQAVKVEAFEGQFRVVKDGQVIGQSRFLGPQRWRNADNLSGSLERGQNHPGKGD